MEILIRNTDPTPIYEQTERQIKAQILSGKLKAGDPMPGIRSLARDLHISAITTKRAYDDLEQEGFLFTAPAKGSFVAAVNISLLREMHLKEIEGYLSRAAELAAGCGLSEQELLEMLRLQLEER
jgi:GntR family transcriptional regulator